MLEVKGKEHGSYFTIRDELGAELRLPVVKDMEQMTEALEFLAGSWWRRTLIKLISGGRLEVS